MHEQPEITRSSRRLYWAAWKRFTGRRSGAPRSNEYWGPVHETDRCVNDPDVFWKFLIDQHTKRVHDEMVALGIPIRSEAERAKFKKVRS